LSNIDTTTKENFAFNIVCRDHAGFLSLVFLKGHHPAILNHGLCPRLPPPLSPTSRALTNESVHPALHHTSLPHTPEFARPKAHVYITGDSHLVQKHKLLMSQTIWDWTNK